jgi:hypothetical protein
MIEAFVLHSQRSLRADKIVNWAEENKRFNRSHSYWEAHSKDFLLTMLEQGNYYPWHSDSHNTAGEKNDRLWTQIIYLTTGSPICFGIWNNNNELLTDRAGSSIPVPDTVDYSVDPYPGLQIQFPSFLLHSVPVQKDITHRWAMVSFLNNHPSQKHEELYNLAKMIYFKN